MGITRGKQPLGIEIGKVHKTMDATALVFRDATSSLDDLIARVQENPLHLTLADVTIEEPGHPIEGENWRPQLAPYKPWVHDAALDETEELDGTDGDLLIVGALGMGITDEERMGIIGSAVRGEEGEGPTASAVGQAIGEAAAGTGAAAAAAPARKLSPHELWTLGQTPRWQPKEEAKDPSCENARETQKRETSQNRETLLTARETSLSDRETSQSEETYFATNVPITVRRDGEGYAVSAVHLGKLAEHGLRADGLIVVVPSFIDDVPVVRIASEAFSRRFTSGAQVRLLVVPDTVEVVGSQAFNAVSAEVVYLGAGVRTYDPSPLDMALPNPRLEARRYLVSPVNKCYAIKEDCLLERLGGGPSERLGAGDARLFSSETMAPFRLIFASAPYAEHFVVPDGVRVMSAAFAKGCPPPRVIDVPDSLERVDGSMNPETLWRASDPAALARIVARCGGRVTDFQAVEKNQCWYGFAEGNDPAEKDGFAREDGVAKEPSVAAENGSREAHLVAGPPAPDSPSRQFSSAAHARMRGATAVSAREAAANAASAMVAPVSATDRLALPREVEGAPLTLIAERALITAPATLVIPDTVREVRDDNACKGTRKLMLPEGLRTIGAHCFCSRTLVGPVLIPASVTSIGEGSFEYAIVRLAAADAVVHITSDQLISCFLEDVEDGIPFDFARYDDQLLVGRGLPDHLGALLHRVAAPFRLAPEMRDRIVEALRERAAEAVQYVAREGDIAMVRALADAGFLNDVELFDRQIERLRASNRTDCVLFLMNWQHDRAEATRATAPKRARDRFAL